MNEILEMETKAEEIEILETETEEVELTEKKELCKKCGTELFDAKFCPDCKKVTKVVGDKADTIFCSECGGKLLDKKACSNCRIVYDSTEMTDNKKQGMYFKSYSKGLIAFVLTLIILFGGKALYNNFSPAKKLQNILEANGVTVSDLKIICSEPLSNVKGENGESSWEYVLCYGNANGTPVYMNCPVDFKNGVFDNTYVAGPFVAFFRSAVFITKDEKTNKALFYEMKNCINEGGLDYFENIDNSMNFLRKITGVDGIIPTAEARDIMFSALRDVYGEEKFNQWNAMEEFHLLFEAQNAVPKVIAGKTTTKRYRWNYPEAFLGSMDSETKSTFYSLFGPPYADEPTWLASVIDEATGNTGNGISYPSLEAIKKEYNVYETGDVETNNPNK